MPPALHFLHDHAGEPIAVGDLVGHLLISRRSLEMRFRKAVGRTIHEELQRVRLERAKRLLLETDLPIPSVAEAAGFASPSYLGQVFRRTFGVTPARYRRQGRTPAPERCLDAAVEPEEESWISVEVVQQSPR